MLLINLVITLVRALLYTCSNAVRWYLTPFFLCLEKLHYLSFLDVETKESSLSVLALSRALAAAVFPFSFLSFIFGVGPSASSHASSLDSEMSQGWRGSILPSHRLDSWDVTHVQEGASVWRAQLREMSSLGYCEATSVSRCGAPGTSASSWSIVPGQFLPAHPPELTTVLTSFTID